MNKNLPNFLIVGAAKSATTTIHEYLKQHPDIFMTQWKEPSFFAFKNKDQISYTTDVPVKFVTNIKEYKSLFIKGENKKIKGESSTPYLYFYKETIDNIKAHIHNYKDVKILIVLRNPIDRAFSQYMMKIRDVVEDMSFKDALKNEKRRIKENAHFDFFYADRGLYYKQVKAFLDEFNHVKIVLYDEFRFNPEVTLDQIINFLRLDKFKFEIIDKKNVSGKPKLKFLNKFIKYDSIIKNQLKKIISKKHSEVIVNHIMKKNLKKIQIDEESKNYLKLYYKEDIEKLEGLIHKDLSIWL